MWGIEFNLVSEIGSKVTCFLSGGSKLTVCGSKLTCSKCCDRSTWFSCGWWWSKLTRFLDAVANRLVLVIASRLTWFLSGWSILTWFQCGESNLTWFQCRDRNWFVFCLVVENDLILMYQDRNWLGFCVMIFDLKEIYMESWQIYVLVMFYKTTQPPLTE